LYYVIEDVKGKRIFEKTVKAKDVKKVRTGTA